MTVTEAKHQAHLQEWHEKILNCRGSGLGVKGWCRENHVTVTTYYRWEREIFGKAQRGTSGEIALAPAATFAELPVPVPQELPAYSSAAPSSLMATIRIRNSTLDVYSGADAKVVEVLCKALNHAE